MANYARGRPLDEQQLKAIVKIQISNATGDDGGEISDTRRQSMEYYLGEPLGNEVDGRSQVISTDVSDTIESLLPDLVPIFTAGDDVVRFEPVGEEDEEAAKQATDLVNHVWNKDNQGFNIFYDWFKDALLAINGFLKVSWDETEHEMAHFYERLTEDEYLLIVGEDGVEVDEHSEYPDDQGAQDEGPAQFEEPPPDQMIPDLAQPPGDLAGGQVIDLQAAFAAQFVQPMLHDVKVKRTEKRGRVLIETVPPEEFLIERRARNIEDASFVCHKVRKTASDLIQMGFDRERVANLPSTDEQEYNEERIARFNRDDEWPYDEDSPDEATREIWVYDCYIRIDYDDDGIAELRRVMTAGPGYEILLNEEAAMMPFVSITPIRMPHKFFGRSVSELVEDIQVAKTTFKRQLFDNLYQINNQRAAINDKVNIDDWLDNTVGGAVRVEGDEAVGNSIMPLANTPITQEILAAMEYSDKERETRTGVTRYGQGLDPDSLETTASGMNMMLGRQQQRILLIAQVFAEGGVKDANRKVLQLLIEHQDKPRTIRLRNQWVAIDPRSWNAEMDMTISVGIGHGTRDQQMVGLAKLIEMMEKVITYQGGIDGPLVTLDELHNALSKFTQHLGFKNPDMFWVDPQGQQQQPKQQKPDPAMQRAMAEMQMIQQRMQAEVALNQQKMQADNARKIQEIQLEHQRGLLKLQLEAQRDNANTQNDALRDFNHNMVDAQRTEGDLNIKAMAASAKAQADAIKAAQPPSNGA
jgi:hypothetical protein